MKRSLSAGLPVIKRIANICAFAAILPLIFLAEWVPGLLPHSPNLAYSSDPAVSSVTFPIVAGALGLVGIASWLLLRRMHWSGLWAFAVFWLTVDAFLLRSANGQQPLDYIAFFGLAVLLAFPVVLAYGLYANWKVALRSNTSLARAREK